MSVGIAFLRIERTELGPRAFVRNARRQRPSRKWNVPLSFEGAREGKRCRRNL